MTQTQGRPVVLTPMRPGLWLVIAGAALTTLGPLFGFLAGSMIGPDDAGDPDPQFVSLMVGFMVGGVGILAIILGARRLLAHLRAEQSADQSRGVPDVS